MQRSVVIFAFPFLTRMASVGQRVMQLVQPLHFSASKVTEWKYSFILCASYMHYNCHRRSFAYFAFHSHFIRVAFYVG